MHPGKSIEHAARNEGRYIGNVYALHTTSICSLIDDFFKLRRYHGKYYLIVNGQGHL